MDFGHQYAERRIKSVKSRAAAVYSDAEGRCRQKVNKYLSEHETALKTALERLESGEIDRDEYERWCQEHIFTKEWTFLCEEVAKEMNRANNQAVSLLNDVLAEVYAENYNYAGYQVDEQLWRLS